MQKFISVTENIETIARSCTMTTIIERDNEKTFPVDTNQLPELEKTVRALNRRCHRLGLPEVEFSLGAETDWCWYTYVPESRTHAPHFPVGVWVEREVARRGGLRAAAEAKVHGSVKRTAWTLEHSGYARTTVEVTMSAPSIQLDGYDFIGAVDHTLPSGNIVRVLGEHSETEIPAEWWDCKPTCDHCGTKRARNVTYIVRETESGELLRVGSTCLADYTGHKQAAQVLATLDAWRSKCEKLARGIEEEHPGVSGGGRFMADLEEHLAWCALALERTNTRNGRGISSEAWNLKLHIGAEYRLANYKPTEKHREFAQNALQWLRETENPHNNYMRNLCALAQAGLFDPQKHSGYVGSILPAYDRHLEGEERYQARQKAAQEAREAREQQAQASEWLGSVGERLELTEGVLVAAFSTMSHYGTSRCYKVRDSEGNIIVWWNSGRPAQVEQGDRVTIGGRIKKHDSYQGERQTVLTRAKLNRVES